MHQVYQSCWGCVQQTLLWSQRISAVPAPCCPSSAGLEEQCLKRAMGLMGSPKYQLQAVGIRQEPL